MTVETSSSKVVWLGNGAISVFSYNFEIDASTTIVLTYTDPSGNVTTLGSSVWSVTGLGNPAGGTITYPLSGSPIPYGSSLTLQRVVPFTQPTNLANQGGLWPSVVMAMDDNLEYQIQQVYELASRAIVVSVSESGPLVPLPPAATRANMALTFNSVGAPIASLPANGNAVVSAAMVPVVDAVSISVAEALLRAPYGEIWLTDFAGADPTGVGYNDSAFSAFVTAVMSTGRPGFIPAGDYRFASQATMDFGQASAFSGAATFHGVLNRSVLDFSGVTGANPALQITDSVGGQAAFYGVIRDISIKANCAGPAVAIGQTSHADAFNGFEFKLQIANASASSAAIGLQVNGAYDCGIWVTANCGGHGYAMQCTEMNFCTVAGSLGHADIGLYLTSAYSFGNTYNALDIEAVNTCVQIDVATASRNLFLGGQFVWNNGSGPAVAGINATAGGLNRFIGGNFGSPGTLALNAIGVIVYGSGTPGGTEVLGGLLVSPLRGDGDVQLDSVAGNSAFLEMTRAGVMRWQLGRNNAAESGSNVGSDFLVTRFNDAGVAIDNPFYITRSTGQTNITQAALGVGTGGTVGFFGAGPQTKPTVSGSRSSGAALTSLIGVLSSLGLLTDGTSA